MSAPAMKAKAAPLKRRVPRRAINARIGILVHGNYSLTWAHEIGEGGMLISSEENLKVGDRLVVTFRIPEIVDGVMLARVVYTLPDKTGKPGGRYGVQFDKVDFDVKRKIRNYVASSNEVTRKSEFF
jgi:Tfp pilus assembly protein PilZ